MPLIDITTAFKTNKINLEGENKEPVDSSLQNQSNKSYEYTANEINRMHSFIKGFCNDSLQLSVESDGSVSDIDDPIRMLSATIKNNLLQTTYTVIAGTPDQNVYTVPASTDNKKFLPRSGKINSINGYNLLITAANTTSDVRISIPLVDAGAKKVYHMDGVTQLTSSFLLPNHVITIFYDSTLDNGSGGFKCIDLGYLTSFNGSNQLIQADSSGKISANNLVAPYFIGEYKYIVSYNPSLTNSFGTFLLCNGQSVSRTTYANLFDVIGTTFGAGDGSTTFTLPDFRGRVAGMIGQGSGLTNRIPGDYVGEESHTLTAGETPQVYVNSGELTRVQLGTDNGVAYGVRRNDSTFGNLSTLGGSQPHNNMQPTLFAGNYFIYAG